VKKYQDHGNLETTMAEKRTRDVMEGLEQEVLGQQWLSHSPPQRVILVEEAGRRLHAFLATRCSSYKEDTEWSLALPV
jgi:hypothetical protein